MIFEQELCMALVPFLESSSGFYYFVELWNAFFEKIQFVLEVYFYAYILCTYIFYISFKM